MCVLIKIKDKLDVIVDVIQDLCLFQTLFLNDPDDFNDQINM